MPNNKQYSPALQTLQFPMNIIGKVLEILIPALPAPPPCVYPLYTCCHACGQIIQTFPRFLYTT